MTKIDSQFREKYKLVAPWSHTGTYVTNREGTEYVGIIKSKNYMPAYPQTGDDANIIFFKNPFSVKELADKIGDRTYADRDYILDL